MKYAQQVRDEPNANPVPNLGVRVRRKKDGVTLATVTTDEHGICRIEGDGHFPPFVLETTNEIGGPRLWSSNDTMTAGALSPAEVPYALRAFGDGYIPGFLNNLAVGLSDTTLTLNTGGALVNGYPVINYTADTFNLARPSSGTRMDRLVVRVYGPSHEDHGAAEFAILAGTVGAGTPSLTQTDSVYEVALAQVTVPDAGSLTLTDERVGVLLGLLTRKAPVSGVARSAGVATDDTSGEAVLSLDLVLPVDTTYDIEADVQAHQTSYDAYAYDLKFGTDGTGNTNFNNPGQIARDSSGNIYVADTANNRLKKHDSSGTYVTSITSLTGITGVCVDSSGNVYVAYKAGASDYKVRKYDSSGTLQWTNPGSPVAFQHLATDGTHVYATVANNVYKYLCSTGAAVSLFHATGTAGSSDGQFTTTLGIATDDTYVYVVDQGNDRVQKFTTSGTFVTKWGTSGTGAGQFQTPVGIAINPINGNILVTDSGRDDIQEFTNTGTFVRKFSGLGSGDGQVTDPTGIVVTADGLSVYIADTGNDRVTKFSAGGYGSIAVSIDGDLSTYLTRGASNGVMANAHTHSVAGPATVTVSAYAKATDDTMGLGSCVLSATARPRQ